MKDLNGRLANQLGLRRGQVERTVALFDEGSTVPFVARYRKEITGGLDEIQLAEFRDKLNALRKLQERQEVVLRSIEDQGALTPELAAAIEAAETLQQVEDLYLPYKPKRRTRAQIARERGLEPLAQLILKQEILTGTREEAAAAYLSEDVPTADHAWQGARDIVAEVISDDAKVREVVRQITWQVGELRSTLAEGEKDPKRIYETYYEFSARLKTLKPHQVLALNRGDTEGALRVAVEINEEELVAAIRHQYPSNPRSPLSKDLMLAAYDSYDRLIAPAIEREVRNELTDRADEHAINVFSTNLRNLLLTAPIKGATVMGIDPGFRTGCKVAVVDATGKLLDTATIYPHEPQKDDIGALQILKRLVKKYRVSLISIGNGTASRETEELVAGLIADMGNNGNADLHYLIVNEAGASVYSASLLARAELPTLDVSLRGAVSIARRAQDPLAELVKIDPKSIGVGMYQHDVNQTSLAGALAWVTESVVNSVGVDINTASPALLQHVAGVGPKMAEHIVEHRDTNGPFTSRVKIKKVKGMGDKTFEQAAGFLRIPEGESMLDNTGVHPESYAAVAMLLSNYDFELDDPDLAVKLGQIQAHADLNQLAEQIGVGTPTLKDIFVELQRPGRDPREDIPAQILREDVLKMGDLKPGMKLRGTVRNVVDFGAFIDIGVKQDGLVHISQMANKRIDTPYEVVGVGDIVDVTVINVDLDRGRIGLSMRN